METYNYKHETFGDCIAVVQEAPLDSPYIGVSIFQKDSQAYTSFGTIWVTGDKLGDETSSNFAGLQYMSTDLWAKKREAKIHHVPKIGFPIHLQTRAYNTEHLKVFIRAWKATIHFAEVGKALGISDRKVSSILKRLRSAGVKIAPKYDEPKAKKLQKFDWNTFVRAIRGSKFIETAVNSTGIPLPKLLFLATLAQDKGVRLTIPPFQNQPEWIEIRAKNDLKQIIRIKPKHGSGRNFKMKWAGYKKQYRINPELMKGF